jgi:hypothetical protein
MKLEPAQALKDSLDDLPHGAGICLWPAMQAIRKLGVNCL